MNNKVEIMRKVISEIKELQPYEEVFSPLESRYQCCIKKDLLHPIELQLQADFYNKTVDIMIFPHPRIVKEKNSILAIRFINELNSYKITYNLLGKFIVLEDDLDIAFCTNLNYELIDCYSDYFLYSIIKPIQILIEIIPIVYHLSNEQITYERSLILLNDLWG